MSPERAFSDAPATRGEIPLLIGIMSPSGGGKTRSALRLATGIQRVVGGDIWGIDTENLRMKAYAPLPGQKADPFHPTDPTYNFRHVPFSAPFGSLDYLAAVQHCVRKGAKVVIVDSMTHEHIGEGGYLETAEAIVTRIAGNDYKKREAVKMLGWATAGPLRQKMIEGLKQLNGAFIFCFRAKEKTKPVTVTGDDGRRKTEVVDMGLMPIAGEEWIYEMLVNCMLLPRSGGVPTWRSDAIGEKLMMKLPSYFEPIFAKEQPLSEDIGQRLAEWAVGGARAAAALAPAAASDGAVGTSSVGATGDSPFGQAVDADLVSAFDGATSYDERDAVAAGARQHYKGGPWPKAVLDAQAACSTRLKTGKAAA